MLPETVITSTDIVRTVGSGVYAEGLFASRDTSRRGKTSSGKSAESVSGLNFHCQYLCSPSFTIVGSDNLASSSSICGPRDLAISRVNVPAGVGVGVASSFNGGKMIAEYLS